jgi:ABC-type transport system involved in multi-copper enzyme maturation permease subunit
LDRIFEVLLSFGYPPKGVDWLRRHRTYTIMVLALLSWALFIGLGYLLWTALAP